ncbi:MAG: HAMP domain-containing sensor histidine kinase [Proteobacteria bacterium]|nr:HAMP domain-containing sensor histidine kinase [Pseudomonadota bacterium]
MSTDPAPLGRGLGRSLAIATAIGMIVFGTILAYSIYSFEVGERCEETPVELIKQSLFAFVFAGPIGVGLALVVGRRLIHATTDRLDDVIASASRMTGERLDERLPVGGVDDALDRLAGALNDLLHRIEAGVAAQRQFAADASHELRTPLAVISTKLEVARRKARDPAHWEHVADDTLAEVRRMNDLVDKLLVLSRAGAAGLHLERERLHALASSAIAHAIPIAAARDVTLELGVDPAIFASVDAEAIAIVLDNLLRNAIAHAPRGSAVDLSIGPGPRIVVDDRGPGVPAAMRARVFEPFARGVHEATDRAGETGLGLGLAICKRIVDGHRGSIVVEDRPGGGARFVVTLPDG